MSQLRARVANFVDAAATLRVQLVLWYVALLALILIGFCALLDATLAARSLQQLDGSLASTAAQLSSTLNVQDGQLQFADNADNLVNAGTVIGLYRADGRQLLSSSAPGTLGSLGLSTVSPTERGVRSVVAPSGGRWRVLVRPATDTGRRGLILVAYSESDIYAVLHQLYLLELFAVPLVLAAAGLAGSFLANRALGPIDRMTRAAAAIGEKDLSRRLGPASHRDEVGRLAETLDAMLDRLDRAFERQHQFTADASHELRTPLAIIRSRAEVALDRPRSTEEYREALAAISAEVLRLNQLASDLLTLARADAREEQLQREPVALDELVTAVVSQFEPVVEARHVSLELGLIEPVTLNADSTRLVQLMINLIDNGLKFTPPEGKVRVDLMRREKGAELVVSDTGVGIPAEHLPHLFERFYRVDVARGRSGGAGLGLAISDWIVRSHGGEIRVESVVGEGSVFRVILPDHVAPAAPEMPSRRRQAEVLGGPFR